MALKHSIFQLGDIFGILQTLGTYSLYHITLHFVAVENIVRKGEIACNKQFLLFSQCFLFHMPLIFHFKCTLKCRLQFVSIWISLKFCRLVIG